MLRTILVYGSGAGLIVGAWLFFITLVFQGHPPDGGVGMAMGYASMLVALSLVFLAIKRRRDGEGGGVIRFWPAFAVGLGVSLVASLFYVVAWELALAVTGSDFAETYARAMVRGAQAKGLTGEAFAKVVAEAQSFRTTYANPLYRWPMTFVEIFPVGVIVSLISAAVLRNSRVLPAQRVAAA